MNTNSTYYGIRNEKFNIFIREVLSLSKLSQSNIDIILDKEGIQLYEQVFTHSSVDPDCNYEFLEFLGDVTLNKSIAWYLSRRFEQLNCAQGVSILTRLKINLISKKSFAEFAKQLFFWDFISATNDVRSNKMTKILEDVFESFFGATELLIDKKIYKGAGYSFCYNIIEVLMNTRNISLKHEDLFDAKTRLKEIFDHFGKNIGKIKYEVEKVERIHYVKIYREYNNNRIFLGKGSAPLKIDAEQKASEKSIKVLTSMNFIKPLNDVYRMLNL